MNDHGFMKSKKNLFFFFSLYQFWVFALNLYQRLNLWYKEADKYLVNGKRWACFKDFQLIDVHTIKTHNKCLIFCSLLKPALTVWDLFPEGKKVLERKAASADDKDEDVAFGYLRVFFKDSNFENLRTELKKEYKDETTFNWLVANKVLQPLSGGHVFIDKIPNDVDISKCDKVTYPGSEKIIKGLAFGKTSEGSGL